MELFTVAKLAILVENAKLYFSCKEGAQGLFHLGYLDDANVV